MDLSSYAAPLPPRQSAVTRRLALAVAALFVSGVIAATVALLGIAERLDNDEINKTRFYSARALENRITASKNYITSYANWTTAYEHLSGQVDINWAYTEQNVGKTLFTTDGYDGVFVLSREGTRYGVVRGQMVDAELSAFVQVSATALLDQVLGQADLTKLVSHQPVVFEHHPLQIGASIGIALSRRHSYLPSDLIRYADIALYQAKSEGKNTWCYFEAHMSDQIQTRRQMEDDLRHALKHNEFVLHYQPRYKVDGKHIVSVEALVRWQHPTKGLLGPDLFIPLAEQTDLIVPLGRWVLREACETALGWPEDILLSVNLSPAQFAASDVVEDVREVLVQSRFPASRLELEITENVMLNDTDGALTTMNALKELGVRLNMDDFGTGYSSLGYLRAYPFDGIKIDKRFIASISSGANDRAVVQAIIGLGKAMGLTVTAEGVETEEQLDILGVDQCNEVQGYFMSRPLDKAAFARLLQDSRGAQLKAKKGRVT